MAEEGLYVHYYDTEPCLVAPEYTKTVTVDPFFGQLHVQEDYQVVNAGPLLKGHFSRVDHKLAAWGRGKSNAVEYLQAILPAGANNVYFKDAIGNVSTSHFRNEKRRSLLELTPRFPLFGGWKYTWFHGYQVSWSAFVSSQGEDYTLLLPLARSISGLTIEQGLIKVILPEGAENIKITSDYPLKQSESQTFTYFDTTGRPTLLLSKENWVDEQQGQVKIVYTLPQWRLYQKPAIVIAFVLGGYLFIAVLSSLDLSIVKVN